MFFRLPSYAPVISILFTKSSLPENLPDRADGKFLFEWCLLIIEQELENKKIVENTICTIVSKIKTISQYTSKIVRNTTHWKKNCIEAFDDLCYAESNSIGLKTDFPFLYSIRMDAEGMA